MKDLTKTNEVVSKERREVLKDLTNLTRLSKDEGRPTNVDANPTRIPPQVQAPDLRSVQVSGLNLAGEIWLGSVAPNLECLIKRCSCPPGTCKRRNSPPAATKKSKP